MQVSLNVAGIKEKKNSSYFSFPVSAVDMGMLMVMGMACDHYWRKSIKKINVSF